jgi:hypothetical protein
MGPYIHAPCLPCKHFSLNLFVSAYLNLQVLIKKEKTRDIAQKRSPFTPCLHVLFFIRRFNSWLLQFGAELLESAWPKKATVCWCVCVNHCRSLGRWTTIASDTSQRNKILLHPFSKWTYDNVLAMIKQQRNSKNIRSYIRVTIIRLFEGSLCKMRSITCYPHASSLGKVLPNRRAAW